ncbi:uracil-DNA glycosylase family protein [Wielerella bovis]|uniref:uracil-DNA glycosylase family protein n=1 Tax=Wielerella bovis TaxID=2917790 RepID=UPI0020194820|nr:uracil-DNA glycosylase family protein [Wielerella bovis]ULJ60124.1 uracil-DNA glycosylase [Wielerella bovis]
MLNSRYVHLHEALGLGVMWLNANAKIITPIPNPVSTPDTNTFQAASTTPTSNKHEHSNARLAALQRVRGNANPTLATENHLHDNIQTIPHIITQATQPSVATPQNATIMAMSVCPSVQDIAAKKLFSGDDGVMLYKMLAAIGLQAQDVYLTTWLKDFPDFNPKPPTEIVVAAAPRVAQEWQKSGAKALLLLGDLFFDREDVQQQIEQFCPHHQRFIIPHPMRIINNQTLKRGAWETLQRLEKHIKAA